MEPPREGFIRINSLLGSRNKRRVVVSLGGSRGVRMMEEGRLLSLTVRTRVSRDGSESRKGVGKDRENSWLHDVL